MTGNPIEVYVELAGREKYHESLVGRDKENQHPISAITNLQDKLDEIGESLAQGSETVEELRTDIEENIADLETNLTDRIEEVNTDLTESIDSLTNSLFENVEDLKNRITNLGVEITNDTDHKLEELEENLQQQIDQIDLEAYYTKEETDEKLEGTFHYKGQVTDFESLPVYQNEKGDVYNVQKSGANYVWTGYAWDNLSPTICLKGYATKEYVDGVIETSVRLMQDHLQVHYYTKEEIDQKIDEIIHIGPEVLRNVFVFKGAVNKKNLLPETNNKIGDVYVVLEDKSKWFWAGVSWEILAEDLTDKIYTKDEINDKLLIINNNLSNLEQRIDEIEESTVTQEEFDNLKGRVDSLDVQLDNIKDNLNKINEQRVWHEIE